jgi:hypothetical protein
MCTCMGECLWHSLCVESSAHVDVRRSLSAASVAHGVPSDDSSSGSCSCVGRSYAVNVADQHPQRAQSTPGPAVPTSSPGNSDVGNTLQRQAREGHPRYDSTYPRCLPRHLRGARSDTARASTMETLVVSSDDAARRTRGGEDEGTGREDMHTKHTTRDTQHACPHNTTQRPHTLTDPNCKTQPGVMGVALLGTIFVVGSDRAAHRRMKTGTEVRRR